MDPTEVAVMKKLRRRPYSRTLPRRWEHLRRALEEHAGPRGYEALTAGQWPPLQVMYAGEPPQRLFYFTKDLLCRDWLRRGWPPFDWSALVRPRLPSPDYLAVVRTHARGLRLPLLFVGDLKPLDLTIFATLRSGDLSLRGRRLRGLDVCYLGVDDRLLALSEAHLLPGYTVERLCFEMWELEREHFQLMRELLPDLEELVGPRCLRLLESGRSLDLAALTNVAFHDETYQEELYAWFHETPGHPGAYATRRQARQ